MRQGHVFGKFMKESLAELTLTAEKNSKKEAKRLIEEMNSRSIRNAVFHVDINKLSMDKATDLIVKSQQLLNGLMENDVVVAILQSDRLNEVTGSLPADLLYRLEKSGQDGLTALMTEMSEEQLLQAMVYVNKKAELIVEKMKEQKEFYEEVLQKADQRELIELAKSKKFSFKTYQTNLFSMYEHCFNLVTRIASPFLAINPDISFQRKLVWPLDKKVEFIDSLINEIPIGAFYVNDNIHDLELGEGFGRILWDGKQRMYALHSFILDEFPVQVNGKEVYYSQSPMFFNSIFRNTSISMFESTFTTLREIIEAYISINKKQIRHTDEDLEHAMNILLQRS